MEACSRDARTSALLRAGFELVWDENVYFDIVKALHARRPQ